MPKTKNDTVKAMLKTLPKTKRYSIQLKSLKPAKKLLKRKIAALTNKITKLYHTIALASVHLLKGRGKITGTTNSIKIMDKEKIRPILNTIRLMYHWYCLLTILNGLKCNRHVLTTSTSFKVCCAYKTVYPNITINTT